ncbi:anti-anti-sigma factor [Actinokineospora alba]|uniref:Anti-sigma factor antagonist n=1 Tax=Actinokineospora alba TaxID=504798 RepID=A0A1H0EPD7_9PSEU|nr:STAS domain-containing protein [Actinokineospora alba]TDP69164.1 anti-anti-sigma factor [Actinokineospora alba]SDI22948.1 anti-anti-sigma factor [Actinokineospora alba]SDN84186.1 anti-anti-sigma factor [Actinokineospora alba]
MTEPDEPTTAVTEPAMVVPGLEVTARQASVDTVILLVTGEIDMLTAPSLDRSLAETADGGHRRVVVDLSGVTFLSSAGITILVQHTANAAARGVRLPIVASATAVLRPLELTGLNTELDLHGTVDEAVHDA